MAIELKITGGIIIIDDDMLKEVSKRHWFVASEYVKAQRGRKQIRLHHTIVGKPPPGLVTDHINGNPLDNRRENLRFVPQSYNMASAFRNTRGYYFCRERQLWCVSLTIRSKRVNGGRFPSEEQAAARVKEIRDWRDEELR